MADGAPATQRFSRRNLFELTGAAVGLAGLLAACGNEAPAAPGRVGNAPTPTPLPDTPVNDIVYLRTMTSLDHSIIAVYDELAGLPGLDDELTALLARFTDEHTATATELAEATGAAGGEPYECANAWLMRRSFQPALDHITGVEGEGDDAIPPSDDPARDALAMVYAFEAMSAATGQLYVERIIGPDARVAAIGAGTRAAQRAAVAAMRITPPPDGYVSPDLLDPEAEVGVGEDGLFPRYAVAFHFGQVAPVDTIIGAPDENGQRYTVTLEPPAENGYRYEGQTCPA